MVKGRIEHKMTCNATIESGKNKGKVCGREKCHYHTKAKEAKVKTGDVCEVEMKSGERKGEPCGRINCRYHQNKAKAEGPKEEPKTKEKPKLDKFDIIEAYLSITRMKNDDYEDIMEQLEDDIAEYLEGVRP